MTWQDYLTQFALPPAGALKMGAKMSPEDSDCAMFCPFEVASRRLTQLAAAIVNAGLTGPFVVQDGIAAGILEDYSLSPTADPNNASSIGAWVVSAVLTTAADMRIPSGDVTLQAPKGSKVRVFEVLGNLNARAEVTIAPGEPISLRTPLDRNWRVTGWGPTAKQETVETALALDWSEASKVGATDYDFYVQAYWVAP